MEMATVSERLTVVVGELQDSPENGNVLSTLIEVCTDYLQSDSPRKHQAVKALADAAKTEAGRKKIVDSNAIDEVANLEKEFTDEENDNFAVEVCRLGGNVCFDNPAGREKILKSSVFYGLESSIQVLSTVFPDSKFWRVLPSFLHNYCHENQDSLKDVLKLSCQLSMVFSELETLNEEKLDQVENYISFLSGVTKHENMVDFFSQQRIVTGLLKMLTNHDPESILVGLIELFQELFEDESLSKVYCEHGLVAALIKRSDGACKDEDNQDISSEDVSSQCLDLLSLVSSHSSVSPLILTMSPPSELFTAVSSWLRSPPTDHHLATAALLCGNVATSDQACVQLMSTGLPGSLVTHVTSSSSAKVLHAVVGCLRNMSVCQEIRPELSQLGLCERAADLLIQLGEGKDHTVTPKLMSTLRLVTQGREQDNAQLGTNQLLLRSLVKIGQYSLVPGLAIEAARLMSSIIRYSRSGEVMTSTCSSSATSLLLSLLNSPHPQLINETLVSLCLLSAMLPPPADLVHQIDPEFTANKIQEILQMEESRCPKEVKYNAITLMHNILKWNMVSVSEHFQIIDPHSIQKYENDLPIIQEMKDLLSRGENMN